MSGFTSTGSYIINSISGIWNSYGCPVGDNQGLFLYLEDNEIGDSSLIDLVGFDTSKKQLGLLKESKTISELVVMLPMLQEDIEYIEEPVTDPVYVESDPCAPCEDKLPSCPDVSTVSITGYFNTEEAHKRFGLPTPDQPWSNDSTRWSVIEAPTNSGVQVDDNVIAIKKQNRLIYSRTENAWLFSINEEIINKILNVQDYKTLTIKEIKNILDTKKDLNNNNNIVKLMKAMVKYNFPPHLNWLLFPDKLSPVCMYVAEFSSVLNKNDLSNIWQGTMPSIAENPEEEEILIEHFLTDEEMFEGFDIANIDNIKLSLFKCKMRAENNYYNMLANSEQSTVNITLKNYGSYGDRENWYQYNWPYDNFSLVELLKIEGGEVREFISLEDISETVLITSQSADSSSSDTYSTSRADYNAYVASNAPYEPSLYK